MARPKAIHTMVDEVFDKAVDDNLIQDIVEERLFIVNTLKQFLETDEIWEQMVHNKSARSLFINNLQVLFMQETENSILIELATTKHGDE
jgi:Flp pilus assembly CpaF family ATPase